MSDTDGVEEALEMSLRLAVMTAAQVGERRARAREAAERAAQAESAADARELAARLEGERTAARATLAPVERSDWWETASDARIAHVYEGASAWAETDPEVARLKDVMDEQLKDRYGLDTSTGVDREGIEKARASAAEPAKAAAGAELAEAAAVTATAGRLNAEAAADEAKGREPSTADEDLAAAGEALYDSAKRREQFAQDMTDDGVEPDVVEGRILADVSQGAPATEATISSGRRQPKARKSRAGAAATKQHSDRSR